MFVRVDVRLAGGSFEFGDTAQEAKRQVAAKLRQIAGMIEASNATSFFGGLVDDETAVSLGSLNMEFRESEEPDAVPNSQEKAS